MIAISVEGFKLGCATVRLLDYLRVARAAGGGRGVRVSSSRAATVPQAAFATVGRCHD